MGDLKTLLEDVSEKVLHMFACDCAERAMLREAYRGKDPKQTLWEALRTKRAWFEGNCDDETLRKVREEAWRIWEKLDNAFWNDRNPQEGEERDKGRERWIARAVYWCAHDDAWATHTTAWSARQAIPEGSEREMEERWQVTRIRWLAETLEWAGERMTFLIEEGKLEEPEECKLLHDLQTKPRAGAKRKKRTKKE